jgi:type IV pilus assembly protein PilA
MPTKVKGMTSIEVAILVAIVLAIAVAAGWYIYTTFAASVSSQPLLRIVSAVAFTNGTIRIELANTGSVSVNITQAEVFDTLYPLRDNRWIWLGPSAQVVVFVDTRRAIRPGSIIQGKLLTSEGQVIPFSARVLF